MRYTAVVLTLFAVGSACGQGRERNSPDPQSDNVSSGHVTCAAFFTTLMQGLRRSGQTELADAYKGLVRKELAAGLAAAQQGRSEKLATDVTEARYFEYLNVMVGQMAQSFSNIALLNRKYTEDCTLAVKEPEAFDRKRRRELTNERPQQPR